MEAELLDLPDTQGAAPAAPEMPPVDNLPDTFGADQVLPAPTSAAPAAPPAQPSVDPVPPRPGAADQRPMTPPVGDDAPLFVHSNAIANRAYQMAKEQGLPANHVVAILKQESNFDPTRRPIGKDGKPLSSAFGIGQLLTDERTKSGIGDSTDPEVQLRAVMPKMRDAYDRARKALGRDPTPGEMYVVYYQGAGAGPRILANPSASLKDTLDGVKPGWGKVVYEANPWLAKSGIVTNADFIAWTSGKMNSALGAKSVPTNFTTTIPRSETAPPFAPAGSQADDAILQDRVTYKPSPTLWRTVEAAADETTTAYVFRDSPVFAPAPDYKPTIEELEARKQGLPEKFHDRLIGVSPAHSDYLTAQAQRQAENERTLAEAGWTGTGIQLAADILNPVDLGIGIATGGLGAFAGGTMKAGRMAQRIAGGLGAAAGNMASTGLGDISGKSVTGSDYAYAAAWGLGLGFAFGPLAKNPATQDIADAGSHAINRAMTDIESGMTASAGVQPKGLSGAAGDLGAASTTDSTLQFSKGAAAATGQDDAAKTALGALRLDMAGRAGASKNPLTRIAGALFGFDAVGLVGPNGERATQSASVGEMMARIRSGWHNRIYSAAYPQFDEWAKTNGYQHFWQRIPGMGKAWDEFAEAVYDYRMDRRPDRAQFHSPQVAKVDAALAAAYADHLKGNAKPRFDTPDNPGRPLAGMDQVPDNPHYQPRKWSAGKILGIDGAGRAFQDWLEGALLSNHPELGDKAGTIARGMYQNIVGRAYNIDEFMMMSRNGATADVLRGMMHDLGIASADIDEILARLPKGTKPDFAHYRLDIDESFVLKDRHRLKDFVETNAFELFDHYNRMASAWRALGRAQIVDRDGKVVLDGFRSTQEFEQFLAQVRARGYEAGQTPKQIADDAKLLQEQFDRIRGVPHATAGSTADQLMELARNTATMLFGGSFGLSALGDAGRLVALGGVRAFLQHIPAFRQMVNEGGELVYRKALSQDLNAMFAFADEFRPFSRGFDADQGLAAPLDGLLGRLVGASRVGADAVVRMSGMPAINRRIKEAASGIMAQRLYDNAKKAFDRIDITEPERLPDWTFDTHHGSPHLFDRFDMSKVGAGEDTWHAGFGMYVGGHVEAGKFYFNSYKTPIIRLEDGGYVRLDPNALFPGKLRGIMQNSLDTASVENSVNRLKDVLTRFKNGVLSTVGKGTPEQLKAADEALALLDNLPAGTKSFDNISHLYEVKITAKKEHLLDLEMPLAAQDPYIQAAVKKLPQDYQDLFAKSDWFKSGTHVDILAKLRDKLKQDKGITENGEADKAVAELLKSVGIRGTKYLSGPGATQLDGVLSKLNMFDKHSNDMAEVVAEKGKFKAANPELSNFVLFDDKDMRVYSRDGIVIMKLADGREVPTFDLTRLSKAERERMKWFGLDDEMLSRVMAQLYLHAEAAPGFLGDKVNRLNPTKWTDPEAANAFATAVQRGAGRAIMEQDVVGSGTVFDRSPVFRSLLQLRRFSLNAWHQNILHGAAMRDGEAFQDVMWSTFTAAMLYTARTHMKAATADDPEDYLRKHFNPRAVAAATFELSAYSSLIPSLVDTIGMNAIGANPLFGYRNSGLPSNGIFGNPTFATVDALLQAPGAAIRPVVTGRERSQQEWRQMLAIIPFQNNFAVQSAIGAMIHDAPARPPRDGNYSLSDTIFGPID